MPASGGPAVTITALRSAGSLGGSWGTDGTIYFSHGASLWRVSDSSGTPTQLTTPDLSHGELLHAWPQLLPDNKTLVFTIVTAESSRVAVVPTAGGPSRIVIEGAAYGRYLPTGHLVYLQNSTLLAAPFDVSRLALQGTAVPVAEHIGLALASRSGQFAFSADGTLAFVEAVSEEHRSLAWVDRTGRATLLGLPPRKYLSPRVSPGGKTIAAVVREGSTSDVWVHDTTSRTFGKLSLDGTVNDGIAWTPDGQRVTYARRSGGKTDILSQRVDGDRASSVVASAEVGLWPGSWSADGRVLAFMIGTDATKGDIDTIDTAGDGRFVPLLATPATEWGARLSPDGRWMAYVSNASGRWEAFIQPNPGPGNPRQISVDGGTEVVWAPSGRELFFRNGSKLMAVPINMTPQISTGVPRLLSDAGFVSGQPGLPGYDVSADGQRFLMVQPGPEESGARPVHVIIDWFDDLRRLTAAAR